MTAVKFLNRGSWWYVCYARFCGNRCECFALTTDRKLAGEYDSRQVMLIKKHREDSRRRTSLCAECGVAHSNKDTQFCTRCYVANKL